jgi:hypothetical protein
MTTIATSPDGLSKLIVTPDTCLIDRYCVACMERYQNGTVSITDDVVLILHEDWWDRSYHWSCWQSELTSKPLTFDCSCG